MSNNNSNATKNVKEIREEATRLGEAQDLANRLYKQAAPRVEMAVRKHFEDTMTQLEGADELEAEDFELIVQKAIKKTANRDQANQVLFSYTSPRWYLNLIATGLAVVGVQSAVAYGRELLEKRGEGDGTRENPFGDSSPATDRRPARLRKETVASVSQIS